MQVPHEMLSRYIKRRKEDLEICLMSLKHKNYSVLEKVGHQLKGNGETFGHADLSLIGTKLEKAAANKNTHELESTLNDFSLWLNSHFN